MSQPPIVIPSFSINPTLALIGGGLLFIALFLQKGEPERAARAKKAASRKTELGRARARVRELEGAG